MLLTSETRLGNFQKLGYKFSWESSPNVLWLFELFLKMAIFKQKLLRQFLRFLDKLGYFYSKIWSHYFERATCRAIIIKIKIRSMTFKKGNLADGNCLPFNRNRLTLRIQKWKSPKVDENLNFAAGNLKKMRKWKRLLAAAD